jgi:NodT family efflux transporter outer membrane factor (OMF) lipoprotein
MKRLIPLLLICSTITTLLIQGCALHHAGPKQVEMDLPEAYESEPAVKAATPLTGEKWWAAFHDETLDDLMEKAFSGNLDLGQYVARLRQALATSRQTRADGMPYVNFDGSASRSQQVSAAGESVGSSHGYSLAAGYEVDLWNKVKSRTRAQELESAATRQDLHALYLTLSAQVAENYFSMVKQRASLKLIDQTIAARTDNLELVALRYREGMVSALDLYQARQNLANARTQRPAAEAALATTAHALAVLTGGYPTANIGGRLDELPDVPDAFPLGLPSELLRQRPDIQAAMLRLESADHQIAAAVADRFPSINLLAEYGTSESDFGSVISGTVWRLLGNLTMPLIDFDKRKAAVQRNAAVYSERLAVYQKSALGAFQEVEDALVANRSSKKAIQTIRAEAAAAQDALRLSKAQYADGLATYLPVLTAQTTHFDSQSRLLSARQQLISARISLARALGGQWMVEMAKEKLEARNYQHITNRGYRQ